jgi:hypothetical protein
MSEEDCPQCGGTGVVRLPSGDTQTWWYHYCGACRTDLQDERGEWAVVQPFWRGGAMDLHEMYAEAALQTGQDLYDPITGRRVENARWREMRGLLDQLKRQIG